MNSNQQICDDLSVMTVTVLTVLTGAVLVPYKVSEIEKVRKLTETNKAVKESGQVDSTSTLSSSSTFLAVNDADVEVSYVTTQNHKNKKQLNSTVWSG